jgi:ribosomal protein S18 acetylase RimI-like enzyme
METGVTIRFAALHDLPVVERLAQEIWPGTYSAILSPDQLQYMMNLIYSRASLQQQFRQHRFLLAELNHEPVGFASYGPADTPGTYKLHKIYVHPKTQGKGIGKSIIDFVVEQLHTQQGKILRLNVDRYNKARQFYERLDFAVIKEEDIDIGNGYFMNDYVMEKRITD